MKKINVLLEVLIPTDKVEELKEEWTAFHKAHFLLVDKIKRCNIENCASQFSVEDTTAEIEFRKEAMKWWNSLPGAKQWEVSEGIRGKFRPPVNLTGREIEVMYRDLLWEQEIKK